MSITQEEAIHILDLNDEFAPDQVDAAVTQRRTQIQQRIDSAPTESLKDKYRRQLHELDDAKAALLGGAPLPGGSHLSHTMLHDLPVAQASYTRVEGNQATLINSGVMLKIGQTLANGRYQIEEQIGSGGMGVVYRAFDKNRDKDIAIKVLLPSLLSHAKAKDRFLKEARLSSEMSHPHIVTVFDVQQEGAHTFLTMELLQGQSLRDYMNTLRQLRKTMLVDDALRYVDHVCQGLSYAHGKGAVHRDIKPENVWLTETGQAKVMDFGIARLISNTQMTQTGVGVGTAYYMAPEQLQGLSDIDGRADQYAVAIMLYEMLTGSIPTGRIESLNKVNKSVPKSLSLAVDKALSPRRELRFSDMADFNLHLHGKGQLFNSPILKIVGGVVIGIAVIAGLVISFPDWRGLVPDKDRDNNVKQEVARLEGEVKSLQKRVDERRREVEADTQDAKRDVERITGQMSNARNDTDKQKLELSLWEARTRLSVAEFVNQGFREALEGSDGLVTNEGNLQAAQAAEKSNQWLQAKTLLDQTQAAYMVLKDVPDKLNATLSSQRVTWLKPVNGKWSSGDCQGAPTYSVKDPIISVFWPKHGTFEEKVLDVSSEGNLITTVISPEKYKGRLYRYQVNGSTLELSEVSSGRSEVMKRCD